MSPLYLFWNVIAREQGLRYQRGGLNPRTIAPCSSHCEYRSLPKLATAYPGGNVYGPSHVIDRKDAQPTWDCRKWMVPSGFSGNSILATVQSIDSRRLVVSRCGNRQDVLVVQPTRTRPLGGNTKASLWFGRIQGLRYHR